MIIRCKSGAQLVIGECPWVPGAYLSIGNMRGSQGAIVDLASLDGAIAELTRIRRANAAGRREQKQRRKAA